jgi:hypothetical protein
VQLTFAWLLPMTAACALAIAIAVAARSASAGAVAGAGAWIILVFSRGAAGGLSATALTSAVTDANLYLPYLAVVACCAAIVLYATRPQKGLP